MESLNSGLLYPLSTVNLKLESNLGFVENVQGHKQMKATVLFMHDSLLLNFDEIGASSS